MGIVQKIVDVDAKIVSNNDAVLAKTKNAGPSGFESTGPDPSFRGQIINGHSRFFATASPGTGGKVKVKFDVKLASINLQTFIDFRKKIKDELIGPRDVAELDRESGILARQGHPGQRMSNYLCALFVMMFHRDEQSAGFYDNKMTDFNVIEANGIPQETCQKILLAIRALKPVVLQFRGELEAPSLPNKITPRQKKY